MIKGNKMIEVLGESGVKITVYLSSERHKLSDLRDELHIGIYGVYRSLAVLIGQGLVVENKEGNTRFFELTPKGQRLARKLLEADEILKGD